MNIDDSSNVILDISEDLVKSQLSVHLRITKRSGRKSITSIEGVNLLPTAKDLSLEKLLAEMRKKFSCNGSLKDGVIFLQGDHREGIRDLLVHKNLCTREQVKIHGF